MPALTDARTDAPSRARISTASRVLSVVGKKRAGPAVLALVLLGAPVAAAGEALRFEVSLPGSHTALEEAFRPLARYLAQRTRTPVDLHVSTGALATWENARAGAQPGIALDEAHVAGYRIERWGYRVAAKLPGTVRFSVVTGPGRLAIDAEALAGLGVAGLPAPRLGALRLLALYADPVRLPVLLAVESHTEAIRLVEGGRADAALVPDALLAERPDLNVVLTTAESPAPAMTLAPDVGAGAARRIRTALLGATRLAAGREALAAAGIRAFEPGDAAAYAAQIGLLHGTWGFVAPGGASN